MDNDLVLIKCKWCKRRVFGSYKPIPLIPTGDGQSFWWVCRVCARKFAQLTLFEVPNGKKRTTGGQGDGQPR